MCRYYCTLMIILCYLHTYDSIIRILLHTYDRHYVEILLHTSDNITCILLHTYGNINVGYYGILMITLCGDITTHLW